jgi:hypothetical protein
MSRGAERDLTMSIALVLAIAALILGIVSVVESRGRSWAGWGVILLAAIHLIGQF